MSDSEGETSSMETTRMYKDDLMLSRVSLYLSSQDLINNSPGNARHIRPESITFESTPGDISVDFVLVASSKAKAPVDADGWNRRSAFEERIKEQGLLLEEDVVGGLTFVKVHAPIKVLRRYCEILKLRMPMKECIMTEHIPEKGFDLMKHLNNLFSRFIRLFITIDPGPLVPNPHYILTAEYSREKSYLFNEDDPEFFSAEVRTLVIDFILNRTNWGKEQADVNSVGIQCLLDGGVYKAAYPLHDGDYTTENTLRNQLYVEWAMLSKWIRRQPIDQIKEYLGVKYAFYFTWLGFYTHMLIPASIMGLIVFFYGIFTLPKNRLSSDICNATETIMCPLCDLTCDYWRLSITCFYAKLTYLFDNDLTVIFAFLMSIWATLFLELWKRYSATITHRWGLTGFTVEAEHPRPQYLARLSGTNRTKVNMITGIEEPTVPMWKKIPATLFSFSVLLLLIVIAIAAVFGVVLYRMSVLATLSLANQQSGWIKNHSDIFIPTTAAIINLVCIQLLNFVYDKVAIYLTEMELLRTQTEFDESLTIKIYLFQFVNYYTSIIYIAFLKGKYVGYPKKYVRIFDLRQEECSPGGCLMELSIQLFIIMVGQQAVNTIVEMIIPVGLNWFNSLTENTGRLDTQKSSSEEKDLAASVKKPWIEDYKLLDWGPRGLFPEYLEMVMQYGFVTLFVTAFPLGPFFALLNNVFEMRLDATKFLKYYRRPIPHRMPNIGVWYRVLDILGTLSVITNAIIIAFSSNFIPRLMYMMSESEDYTDKGFLNSTLAYFNTHDFDIKYAPVTPSLNVSMCRYQDYRHPPDSSQKYERTSFYYELLIARLTFIVLFQNIVSFVKIFVQWLIPDVPNSLNDRIKRESYLTTQMIIKNEAKKAAEIEHKDGMLHGVNSPQSL